MYKQVEKNIYTGLGLWNEVNIFETKRTIFMKSITMAHNASDDLFFVTILLSLSPEIPSAYLTKMGHSLYFCRF